MATILESIVRPFQTPVIGEPEVEANQVGVPIVILNIGRLGRGRQFQGSFNETVTMYMTKYINETKNNG